MGPSAAAASDQGANTIIMRATQSPVAVTAFNVRSGLMSDRRISLEPILDIPGTAKSLLFCLLRDSPRTRKLPLGNCGEGIGGAAIRLLNAADFLHIAEMGERTPSL